MDKLTVSYKENNLFSNHKYFVTVENVEMVIVLNWNSKLKKLFYLKKEK